MWIGLSGMLLIPEFISCDPTRGNKSSSSRKRNWLKPKFLNHTLAGKICFSAAHHYSGDAAFLKEKWQSCLTSLCSIALTLPLVADDYPNYAETFTGLRNLM